MPEEKQVEWLTTEAAVELTGYSPHYVRRLVRQQRVTAQKWSHVWMIDKRSLLEYQQQMAALGREKFNPKRGADDAETEGEA